MTPEEREAAEALERMTGGSSKGPARVARVSSSGYRPPPAKSKGSQAGLIFFFVFLGMAAVAAMIFHATFSTVSAKDYDQIQAGMSYAQVRQICGSDGTLENALDSSAGAFKVNMKAYSWKMDGGRKMFVVFQGDSVQMKGMGEPK